MAPPLNVKVLEVCRVSPPLSSVGNTFLPLTCFDVGWVSQPPIQRIFFYEFPKSSDDKTTAGFVETILPNLKHSLSLSLQLFYPLAGNLTHNSETGEHEICYVDGDSVSLTIAGSVADFNHLIENHPRDIAEFHPLLPQLHPPSLLALQATVFPNAGISIGITLHHVVADGRSLAHFIKTWSSICRAGDDSLITSRPFHDRTILADLEWLKQIFLHQMSKFQFDQMQLAAVAATKPKNLLATFVLSRANIERLRNRVMENQKSFHCSSFVLACAYVWVCLVKAREDDAKDKTIYFAFLADSRARINPSIPAEYFGNCLSMCCAEAKGRDLASRDGFHVASEAIASTIQGLESGVLKDAENWFPKFVSVAGERIISVAGSPKFRVYDTDFGWGRPKKTEVISIEKNEAMYIGDSREEVGGIEVGLSLPESEMGVFVSLFEEGLKF